MQFRFVLFSITAVSALTWMPDARAEVTSMQAEHLNVELVSEAPSLVPGQLAWFGMVLRHDPHWHSYWINPGDSGLPTRLNWALPAGYQVDEVSWPAPSRFEVGGLYNFGYSGEQLLPIAVHVPADAKPGARVKLSVEAKWLVCREACITGKATLNIDLPIAASGGSPAASNRDLFAAARVAIPEATDWTGSARINGERVSIRMQGSDLPAIDGLDVFAVERRILANSPVKLSREGDTLLIETAKNEYFNEQPPTLDLVMTRKMTNGRVNAWQVRVPFAADTAGE